MLHAVATDVSLLFKIKQLSTELTKGKEKARQQEIRNREQPDIVVKVVCKYRAELFFKISRKTKLSRLFTAWTERMENASSSVVRKSGSTSSQPQSTASTQVNGAASGKGSDASSIHSNSSSNAVYPPPMSFVYTHLGRSLDPEMTVEEAGIEDADEILAVELMDLTGPVPDDAVRSTLNLFFELTRPTFIGGVRRSWSGEDCQELGGKPQRVRFSFVKCAAED